MLILGALLVILQFASKNGPKLPAAFAAAASGGRSLLALNLHTLGFPNSLILFLPSHWPTLARFPPNQTLGCDAPAGGKRWLDATFAGVPRCSSRLMTLCPHLHVCVCRLSEPEPTYHVVN